MNTISMTVKYILRRATYLFACVLILNGAQAAALQNSTANAPAPVYNPAKPTVIAWDLHHVLVTPSKTWDTFASYPQKWEAFKNPLLLIKTAILVSRWAFSKATEGLWNKVWGPSPAGNAEIVSVEEFVRAGEYYNNPSYAELVKLMINAQEPMPGMPELLKDLHDAGYEMHIASNIGTLIFEHLTREGKYTELDEKIFKYIDLDKSHAVTFDPALVPNRRDIIKKPNPKFFEAYLAKNKLDPKETNIIFIDNAQKNVNAANGVGLIGILFKSTDQMRNEFENMKILQKRLGGSPAPNSIPLEEKTSYSK